MENSVSNSSAMSSAMSPGLVQRKFDIVKSLVEWICQCNELSLDIVHRLEDLASDLATLNIWSTEAESDQLLTTQNIKCFLIEQPKRGDPKIDTQNATTVVNDETKKADYIPKIFAMKTDQITHVRYAYGQSVELASNNLMLIDNKKSTFKKQAANMLCDAISKFKKELSSLQEVFHVFATGVLNSNKRLEMSEIAIRGPQDEGIMTSLSVLDKSLQKTPLNETLLKDKISTVDISCVWFHTRQLHRKACSFVKVLVVISQLLDKCIRESYSLWLWADYGVRKIFTELLDNRTKLIKLTEDTEIKAIEMIRDKKMDPMAIEHTEFVTSEIEDSIKVSKADVENNLNLGKNRYKCFNQLDELKLLTFPKISDYIVGSTIVKNKMKGLKVEDSEVPINQLVILLLSGDRWIHIFRSHEDSMPLRSIYCLKMVPESRKENGEDIIELKVVKNVNVGLLANVFSAWEPQPVTFSFTSSGESALWKRLIRFSCLEQDPAFDKLSLFVAHQTLNKESPKRSDFS